MSVHPIRGALSGCVDEFRPVCEVVHKAGVSSTAITAIEMQRSGKSGLVSRSLHDSGIIYLSPAIKYGTDAIVFEANDCQMVRVVHECAGETARLPSNLIVKPVMSITTGSYTLDVLAKFHTLHDLLIDESGELSAIYGITGGHNELFHLQKLLFDNLKKCGVACTDYLKATNFVITLDANNAPSVLVLDPGGNYARTPEATDSEVEEIERFYSQVQETHLNYLGLQKGIIKLLPSDIMPSGERATNTQARWVDRCPNRSEEPLTRTWDIEIW